MMQDLPYQVAGTLSSPVRNYGKCVHLFNSYKASTLDIYLAETEAHSGRTS